MATINNTIYPPLLPTYQKAFIKNSTAGRVLFDINFDVSEYTTLADVQTIEVKITTLEGNASILKGEHYFKNATEIIDSLTRKGKIQILTDDIVQNTEKEIDITAGQFYIIQLRNGQTPFVNQEGEYPINGDSDEAIQSQQNFLTEDALDKFSEWSTMSLIKCIDKPVLSLMDDTITLSKTNNVRDMSNITGYLKWTGEDHSEYLYSYRFRIYDESTIPDKYRLKEYDNIFKDVVPLEDSGVIRSTTSSPNRLNYIFKNDFQDSKRYVVYVSYETDNEYIQTDYFRFRINNFINSSNLILNHIVLSAYGNNELGGNEITLKLDEGYLNVASKYIIFRRADSKTDFKLWDDIHTIKLTKKNIVEDKQTGDSWLQYDWIDWTAEDGIFYKYCVQEVDMIEHRAEKIIAVNYKDKNSFNKSIFSYPVVDRDIKTSDYLTLELKDNYFINKDHTLKLSFDASISSITKTRKDTITETLNSKYPFIYRSGEIEYDSFNIEGVVSIEGDTYINFNTIDLQDSLSNMFEDSSNRIKFNSETNTFADIKKLFKYDDVYELYKQYAKDYDLNTRNDFSIEKMFREKVEEFLCDGTPKLFKNAGLGNKLVMLTDVSLSPRETVGNRIYTFSATMTEIDDITIENYIFYNIIDLNNWQNIDNSDQAYNFVGQYSYISNQFEEDEIDIFTLIQEKYYTELNNKLRTIQHLSKIKIDVSELTLPTSEGVLAIATINGKEFYISSNYPYLFLNNVKITSFKLKINRHVEITEKPKIVIDFLTQIIDQVIYNTSGWIESFENYLGQICKEYNNIDNNIYIDIYDKHYFKNSQVENKVKSVNKLLIQAYADEERLYPLSEVAIGIKDMKTSVDEDDTYYIHYTDKHGVIDLYDEDRIIKEIVYQGMKIQEADDVENPRKNEYIDIDTTIYPTEEALFKILSPRENVIYQVGGLALAFMYNGEEISYNARTNDAGGLDIDIANVDSNVQTAIENQLDNGELDLIQTEDCSKYIYINGHFYKINDDYIQYPVQLKVTYLIEYLHRKKVQ